MGLILGQRLKIAQQGLGGSMAIACEWKNNFKLLVHALSVYARAPDQHTRYLISRCPGEDLGTPINQ